MIGDAQAGTGSPAGRPRARDLGLAIGRLAPGPWNAITDVRGVRVGHTTLIAGDGLLIPGRGPVRTGVTAIVPREGDAGVDPLVAGHHVLNGNGEMTGLLWLAESGLLTTPIALTNTHSVGVVRDAVVAYDRRRRTADAAASWSLPVVAETWDGFLNDIDGMHVRPEHVHAALDLANGGAVAEGCVGGGTGMICHGFKGGIGTSSRVLDRGLGGWTIGALVQANHGQRALLRVDGVPVGRAIGPEVTPLPGVLPEGAGSIIALVATDAPVSALQCRRLAQRATIGIARAGGLGENSSGDIALAFTTAHRGLSNPGTRTLAQLADADLSPLFEATADAVEEAILNALCAATTMTGRDGHTAHALPLDRLRAVLIGYRALRG